MHTDDIAEFSELGDYLDLPMKSYSSGMKLRLAFAIATAFQPDVMILDEWLSAGDKSFQSKAAKRLDRLISNTGIVALASHNYDLLQRVCHTGLVMNAGRPAYLGPIDEAVKFENTMRRWRKSGGPPGLYLFDTAKEASRVASRAA